MRRLVFVLDALAALRETTGTDEPRLSAATTLAELAGTAAVRLGIGESLRPVREVDVHDVRRIARRLELRMAPSPALLKIALDARPERVVLAGEARAGRLEPVPLEPAVARSELPAAVRTLREAGIVPIASIAPELDAVKAVHAAGVQAVELFTGRAVDLPASESPAALERIGDAAKLAAKLRLPVGVGGGLDRRNVAGVLEAVPVAERVAVGRALVAGGLFLGVDRAVRDLLAELG